MTARDELLRAAVYRAHALRGTDTFAAACADVVDGWTLWPLIEYEHALEQARQHRQRRERQLAEAPAAMRASYVIREATRAPA